MDVMVRKKVSRKILLSINADQQEYVGRLEEIYSMTANKYLKFLVNYYTAL